MLTVDLWVWIIFICFNRFSFPLWDGTLRRKEAHAHNLSFITSKSYKYTEGRSQYVLLAIYARPTLCLHFFAHTKRIACRVQCWWWPSMMTARCLQLMALPTILCNLRVSKQHTFTHIHTPNFLMKNQNEEIWRKKNDKVLTLLLLWRVFFDVGWRKMVAALEFARKFFEHFSDTFNINEMTSIWIQPESN